MVKISTSILGIKENFNENIKKLSQTSTDYIHIDIMDGKFVDNTSFDFSTIKKVYENTNKPLDIHFMVKKPYEYIEEYKTLNPIYITIHYEIDNLEKYINQIKENNIKVGISLKPNTNIEKIFPFLKDIDLVLIMSVEPGYGGQKFIESSLEKVKKLKEKIKKDNLNTIIEIDGGINNVNAKKCIENGVDILVSGNFVTNSDNYEEKIKQLRS